MITVKSISEAVEFPNSIDDEQIEKMIHKTFDFKVIERVVEIREILKKGKSALLLCKGYVGNGHYSFGGYKWKVITPFHDGSTFYTTDRFRNKTDAKKASYEIYRGQSLVCGVEESYPTKFTSEHFGSYMKEKINFLVSPNERTKEWLKKRYLPPNTRK